MSMFVERDRADRKLIDVVREQLDAPALFDMVERMANGIIQNRAVQIDEQGSAARKRRVELEAQVSRLVDAIAQAGFSSALQKKLAEAERELQSLGVAAPFRIADWPLRIFASIILFSLKLSR